MNKLLAVIVFMLVTANAQAFGYAHFTGNQKMFTTRGGSMAWHCQYSYQGERFWQAFEGLCPSMIEVD